MKNQTGPVVQNQTSLDQEIMIFGCGKCAQKIAVNLAKRGITSWLTTENRPHQTPVSDSRIQWMVDTRLIHCSGFAGRFSLQLEQKQQLLKKTVPAIVIAEDDSPTPNYSPYGLTAGPRIVSVSELEKKWSRSSIETLFGTEAKIAFFCSWENDTHPTVARRMLEGCLNLQEQEAIRTYFFTGNMKVAATGSEELVHNAKRAGTVFLKFTDSYPAIEQRTPEEYTISYPDELTHENFQVTVDWIVVDETIEPGHHLKELIQTLDIDRDDNGFAQSDNVRRWSNATNRRGIFVAGGARGILSAQEEKSDPGQVSLSVLSFLKKPGVEPLAKVVIHRGRCARCLTCHRLCPHNAIDIGTRITVDPLACQSCGICTAGCPGQAIEMEGVHLGPEDFKRLLPHVAAVSTKEPQIIVFGCSRSAGRSVALIRMSGETLPEGVQFIEVPCAGTISGSHLLDAFETGVDGVLLCTCHTGNCQSEVGNQAAKKRAESIKLVLDSGGIGAQRLQITSVAANMGHELAYRIEAFKNDIQRMNNSSKEKQNG